MAAQPSKQGRYYVNLSPFYYWMLFIEAWLKGRSLAEEGGSLLGAKLMEREPKRKEMLEMVAGRLGVTYEALVKAILDETIGSNLETIPNNTPANTTPNTDE